MSSFNDLLSLKNLLLQLLNDSLSDQEKEDGFYYTDYETDHFFMAVLCTPDGDIVDGTDVPLVYIDSSF